MRYSVKGLPEVQVDNPHCPPLIYEASHFILEAYQVGQAWVPLGESMLIAPDDFLVLHVLLNGF